jgi:hypothetical protein
MPASNTPTTPPKFLMIPESSLACSYERRPIHRAPVINSYVNFAGERRWF